MTELLKRAFEKASGLPDYEQDELARRLIDAIESDERRWHAASPEKLDRLADKALEALRTGRTEPLDPEKL
jgi:hypothetical protein